MADAIAATYFLVGLFVSGCFVGEMAHDDGKAMDARLAIFMLVFGTVLWPATLGMRFFGRVLK